MQLRLRACLALLVLGAAFACVAGKYVKDAPQDPKMAAFASDLFLNDHFFSKWVKPSSSRFPHEDVTQAVLKDTELQKLLRMRKSDDLPPVVIVPSLIGSALLARLHGVPTNHWWCASTYSSWYRVWIDFYEWVPLARDCWIQNMQMLFDPATGAQTNFTGVEIKTFDYGGIDAVNYLDASNQLGVWNDTISVLQAIGYRVGKNLVAAPFDWRPSPMTFYLEQFPALRDLIEDTYNKNGNKRVAVVSLSMGSPYFLLFLNAFVTQEWKDKYIASYTSFDGAFGGSTSAIMSLITLDSLISKLFGMTGEVLQLLQSWGSVVWMLPIPQVYDNDTLWATSPAGNFTQRDFAQMLRLAGPGGYNASLMYSAILAEGFYNFYPPGVECHVFYGYNVSTIKVMHYNTTDFKYFPAVEYGDGDGTILRSGLTLLDTFRKNQTQKIYSYPIANMPHGESVHDKEVLRDWVKILLGDVPKPRDVLPKRRERAFTPL